MKTTLPKQRIKNVFAGTIENIRNHKNPSISKLMREEGYSPSSSRALTVVRTRTWQDLLDDINDDVILARIKEIALDKNDKRASLTASDMLLKLKNRYPANSGIKTIAFMEQVKELQE